MRLKFKIFWINNNLSFKKIVMTQGILVTMFGLELLDVELNLLLLFALLNDALSGYFDIMIK